ncbi:hypothetical protein SOVF_172840 isoform B [Spinacia oleracea]|nr:hypothetical protein SOVF_172840 isoform B [Spinacia oleracea]
MPQLHNFDSSAGSKSENLRDTGSSQYPDLQLRPPKRACRNLGSIHRVSDDCCCSQHNWIAGYIICQRILPCIILILGLFFIPESPRWLEKMGLMEDFEVSLQVFRAFDTNISIEVNEIKV